MSVDSLEDVLAGLRRLIVSHKVREAGGDVRAAASLAVGIAAGVRALLGSRGLDSAATAAHADLAIYAAADFGVPSIGMLLAVRRACLGGENFTALGCAAAVIDDAIVASSIAPSDVVVTWNATTAADGDVIVAATAQSSSLGAAAKSTTLTTPNNRTNLSAPAVSCSLRAAASINDGGGSGGDVLAAMMILPRAANHSDNDAQDADAEAYERIIYGEEFGVPPQILASTPNQQQCSLNQCSQNQTWPNSCLAPHPQLPYMRERRFPLFESTSASVPLYSFPVALLVPPSPPLLPLAAIAINAITAAHDIATLPPPRIELELLQEPPRLAADADADMAAAADMAWVNAAREAHNRIRVLAIAMVNRGEGERGGGGERERERERIVEEPVALTPPRPLRMATISQQQQPQISTTATLIHPTAAAPLLPRPIPVLAVRASATLAPVKAPPLAQIAALVAPRGSTLLRPTASASASVSISASGRIPFGVCAQGTSGGGGGGGGGGAAAAAAAAAAHEDCEVVKARARAVARVRSAKTREEAVTARALAEAEAATVTLRTARDLKIANFLARHRGSEGGGGVSKPGEVVVSVSSVSTVPIHHIFTTVSMPIRTTTAGASKTTTAPQASAAARAMLTRGQCAAEVVEDEVDLNLSLGDLLPADVVE